MKGLLGFLGMSIAGWVGWWLGEFQSVTLAVVLSSVFSGIGLYATRKLAERYLE